MDFNFEDLTKIIPFLSDPSGFPLATLLILPNGQKITAPETPHTYHIETGLPTHASIPGMNFNTLKKSIQAHTHVIDVTVTPAPGGKITQEDLDKIAKEVLKETENTLNDQIVAQKLKTAIQQKAPGSNVTIKIIAPKNNTEKNENDLLIYAIIGLIVVAIVIALLY